MLRSERALQEIQDKAQQTPIDPENNRVIDYVAVETATVAYAIDRMEADRFSEPRIRDLRIY